MDHSTELSIVQAAEIGALIKRRQVIPAAVIDATLTTVALNFIEFGLFCLWFQGLNSSYALFSVVFVPLLMVLAMVAAPALFSLSWRLLRFSESPGTSWLELNGPVQKESCWARLRCDLTCGGVSALITLVFLGALLQLLQRFFQFNLLALKALDCLALFASLPIFYCICLSFFLSGSRLKLRKKQALDFSIEAYHSSKSNWMVRHQRHRLSLGLLVLPLAFFAYLACSLPGQMAPLFVSTGGRLLFVELIFWLFWARPLVSYSRSLVVVLIYSSVFILPFIAWVLLGALLTGGTLP